VDLDTLIKLKEVLLTLKAGQIGDKFLGICGNIPSNIKAESLKYFYSTWDKWPEYSGYMGYPVKHGEHLPVSAFFYVEDCWEGEYGEARYRLVDWLLEQIDKDLQIPSKDASEALIY